MLRVAGKRLSSSSISFRSGYAPSAAFASRNPFAAVDSSSDGRSRSIGSTDDHSVTHIDSYLRQIRGISSGTLAPEQDTSLISATVAAIKNRCHNITYSFVLTGLYR